MAKFGSLVSGFGGADADLDITLLTDCYIKEKVLLEHLSDFLRMELEKVRRSDKEYKVEFIKTASTPLVTVKIRIGGRLSREKI